MTNLAVAIEPEPHHPYGIDSVSLCQLEELLDQQGKIQPTEGQLKVLFALIDNLSRLAFKEITGRLHGRCQ